MRANVKADNRIQFEKYFIISVIIFFTSTTLLAQLSNTISSVTFGELQEGESVNVTAELISAPTVSTIRIAYKTFESTEFKIREMEIIGSTASFQIPGEDILPPLLTYYLMITLTDGNQETYPLGVPAIARPLELVVRTPSEKDKEVIVLSPGPNELIPLNDLFISISLVKVPDDVDVSKTKIFLNEQEITSKIMFAGDLLLFYADNFPGTVEEGFQSMSVEVYDTAGTLYHSLKRDFNVVDAKYGLELGGPFTYSGNVFGEIRNEDYATSDRQTLFSNIGLTFNGKYDDWKFRAYGYVTSEENSTIQPQNRYSLTAENDWLYIRGGDAFPRYPDLLLNGKRVRGIDGRIDYGILHLQGSYGQTVREVEGSLIQTYTYDTAPLQSNVVAIDSATYGEPFGEVNFGRFNRDLASARLALGSEQGFIFGLSYLHAIDDMKSIEWGSRPQENIVAGADFRLSLDNQNFVIRGQAMVSAQNTDITTGTFTDAQIDSIYSSGDNSLGSDAQTMKDLVNALGNFITVNQFIQPINIDELASLASEAVMELNYFNNNFRASYIYRGNDYQSFGQEFTRVDLKGFNFYDRIRLMQNQLFFTFGYEQLEDNLQGTKLTTTKFQTFNASASLFLREDFPSITIGYTLNQNKNDINATDTLNNYLGIDDVTNKYSVNLGYDFVAGIRHNSSLSFMSAQRLDDSFINSDAEYLSTSVTVNSYWTRQLISYVSLTYYNSEIINEIYDYTTISLGGKYRLLQDKLELSLYLSPSFGDFERNSIDFIGNYQVIQNLWLRLQLRFYKYTNQGTNSITGLSVRYNL